ncbi:CHAT domain-containing protein [Fuerstiella marisgermanici]|uniref:CHAT domain-containing protein n=1 Tax=Fuerstiella marisgermanici TaxID=1891926 RepID=UPI00097BA81E|nr:CHAT domain-containing protein [Fuerstiella marisgermanici]
MPPFPADMTADSVERALLLGTDREQLRQLFSEDYLRQLQHLAQQANRVSTRGGLRVLILPGIMGSTLEADGNTIWIDPFDIARGRLTQLALTGSNDTVRSNGVFLPSYLELKLRLQIAGFQPEYFHFDWRQPVQIAGKRLADRIRAFSTDRQRVAIVAHSMGGLVARAALKLLSSNTDAVEQTVLLGTPNFGSFAPAQVMTGQYSTAEWVARLDFRHNLEDVVKDVFSTFTGLCQMLPAGSHANGVDYFDLASFPSQGPRPRAAVLRAAVDLQSSLIAGAIGEGDDARPLTMIAGVGVETVVGLLRERDKFGLIKSSAGDGTVPLAMAELPGAIHRYCQVSHGKLPTNGEVIRAVIDVLKTGRTERLDDRPDELLRHRLPPTSDLHRDALALRMAASATSVPVTTTEIRHMLEPFAAPGEADATTPSVGSTSTLALSKEPVVVGRKRTQRLDLRLAQGDITQAEGQAVMLGIFSDVRPGGAAVAIDQQIDGVLAEVIERRMYSANLGEVFVLPTPRRAIRADLLVLIGLGSFNEFTEETFRFAVENAMRTLLRCQVDNIVTVPIGGGTGLAKPAIVRALVQGLLAALKDAGSRPSLRELTICERDAATYEQLSHDVLQLAASPQLDDLEVTFDREILPEPPAVRTRSGHTLEFEGNRSYLIVRKVAGPDAASSNTTIDVSVLTSGRSATVLSAEQDIHNKQFEQLLDAIRKATSSGGRTGFNALTKVGEQAAELLLPKLIRDALEELRPMPLTLVNDAWSSRVPWEVVRLGDWSFGEDGNLSRRYSTDNISVAKWLRERRQAEQLRFLLVVDPTEDLEGAEREGRRIEGLIAKHKGMSLTRLWKSEATRERISAELESGEHDVLHYAGHAFFDPDNRSASGIVCAGHSVLSGRDLARLDSLPALCVFNACESGRVRSQRLPLKNPSRAEVKMQDLIDRNVSFAEAWLRGGIGNFVGTYWPVGDHAAAVFAETFYGVLLAQDPQVPPTIGSALAKAREQLYSESELDWANYIHYGEPAFRLKLSDRT